MPTCGHSGICSEAYSRGHAYLRRLSDISRREPRTSFRPILVPRGDERPALTVVDTPAVDPGVLEDLGRLSADPTFVERLVRGFRSDAERLVATITDALAARRYEEVKDAAHALKGGAGSVGATQLVALAQRFESSDRDTMRLKAAAWSEELYPRNRQCADVPLKCISKNDDCNSRNRRDVAPLAIATLELRDQSAVPAIQIGTTFEWAEFDATSAVRCCARTRRSIILRSRSWTPKCCIRPDLNNLH